MAEAYFHEAEPYVVDHFLITEGTAIAGFDPLTLHKWRLEPVLAYQLGPLNLYRLPEMIGADVEAEDCN